MPEGISKVASRLCLLLIIGLLMGVTLGWAQGERGTINGVVTDSSGAVVPGAAVQAAEAETGIQTKTVTTSAGVYRLVSLPPGTYTLTVQKQGFRTAVHANINLHVAEMLAANFTLQLGEAVQTVTVSGQAVDISPGAGNYVTNTEMKSWPILVDGDGNREIQSFIFQSLPGTEGGVFAGSINGGQAYSHEILIDGISLGRYDLTGGSNNEDTPTFDSISQFKLQTGSMDARYDGGQTAVANFDVKSGTNGLHGQAYSFVQNEALNANGYNNNAIGAKKPANRIINYGGDIGGPIVIPHVINGRNKAFWFLSAEHTTINNLGYNGFTTLPAGPFLQGDFSSLLNPAYTGNPLSGTQVGTDALGRPVIFGQIYDPATTRYVNTSGGPVEVRDPFAGNLVPSGRWSTVAKNYVNLLPNPSFDRLVNNMPISASGQPHFHKNIWTTKEEYNFSPKNRMAVLFNWERRLRNNTAYRGWSNPPGSPLDHWDLQDTPSRIVRLTDDWTITPSLLNHFGYGYNRFGNINQSVFAGQGWAAKLGVQNVSDATVPVVNFSGPAVLGGTLEPFGSNFFGLYYVGSSVIQDQVTAIHNTHQIEFGFDAKLYYWNNRNGTGSGNFTFSPIQTQLTSFNGETGNAFASFLLGQVASASNGIVVANTGYRQREYSFYGGDNWKVTHKLALDLGLRWTIVPGQYEAFGRMTNMDPAKPNPEAGGRLGALVFGGPGMKTFESTYYGQVEPRVGFSYLITQKLLFRGGYGINHMAQVANFTTPWDFGYNGSIQVNRQNTPLPFPDAQVLFLDNPFPNFTGTLPETNPSGANGLSANYMAPQSGRPDFIQNFNLGFEYLLGNGSSLDVGYVGNIGQRLLSYGLGNLNQQDLSALQYGDALFDPLSMHPGLVPLPYAGFDGMVAQALTPFPQYSGTSYYNPFWGRSGYNALQIQFRKHFSGGFSILASYTWSKALSNVTDVLDSISPQNVNDRQAERSVSDFNDPQNLKLSWYYALPVGPGKRFNVTGWAGKIVGGWNISGIQNYHSGDVLGIFWSNYNDPLNNNFYPDRISSQGVILNGNAPVNFGGASASLPRYLNPAGFADVPTTPGGVPLHVGSASRHEPNSRGPAWATEDFSIYKDIHFSKAEG
ncbi:MAG TPA: TonB-dependent receptor, partial [Terriglobia bacterium]|nr:TonB-dependent receptor [Terriglobia bacterium]